MNIVKKKLKKSLVARNLGNGDYVHSGSLKGGGGSYYFPRMFLEPQCRN